MSEIKVKLERVFDIESGVSKAGNEWKKLSMLFEEDSEFRHKIIVSVMNEKIDAVAPVLRVGAEYVLSYYIESREFGYRWYTDIKLLGLTPVGVAAQPAPAPAPVAAPAAAPQQQRMQFDAPAGGADDLPF